MLAVRKNNWIAFSISALLGLTVAWYFNNPLTDLFFGLSFTGRSIEIQILLFIFYVFATSFVSFALFCLFKNYQDRASFLFSLALILIAIFLAFRIIFLQYQIITIPVQLEYREGAIQLITQGLLEGKNIYALENAPLYSNGYGLIYNVLVLPIAKIFGNTLKVHRLVTAIFSLSSAVLISITVFQKNKDWLVALFGGILFTVGQLYWVIPTARPDAVGLFFFLLSVFIPYHKKFSFTSLILSAFFGLLAFLSKPYFVVSIPILALYIFLFESKRNFFFYCGIISALFVPTVLLFNFFFEAYFFNVFYIHTMLATNFIQHAYNQLGQFFLAYLPLMLGGVLIFFTAGIRSEKGQTKSIHDTLKLASLKLKGFSSPLINSGFDLSLYFFFFSILVVFFKLGRHIGNYMVYLFQLMTPFLIIFISQRLHVRNPYRFMILPFIIINILTFRADYRFNIDYTDWAKAENYITASQRILNSPAITSILLQQNKPVVDSGQTQYYYVHLTYSPNIFLPDQQELKTIGKNYKQEIEASLKNQSYDYVMISTWDSPFTESITLQEHYELEETLYLPMPQSNQNWLYLPIPQSNHLWEINVWKPKQLIQ